VTSREDPRPYQRCSATKSSEATTVMESVFHQMDDAAIFGHDVPKMSISSWLQSIHQYIRIRHHHHHPAAQVPSMKQTTFLQKQASIL
jgi:hypothetical protein